MIKSRRNFIKGSLFILPALHLGLQSCTNSTAELDFQSNSNLILRLELLIEKGKLDLAKKFYVNKMNFPLIKEDSNSIEVMAGKTLLKFSNSPENNIPFYHFAFNIPENKIDKAVNWAKKRFHLLKNKKGQEVIHFTRWDAHAIYFYDPLGNILEFIAHHPLKNKTTGEFTEKDVLFICEIGLVSPDVRKLSKEIETKVGLKDYIESDRLLNSSTFRAIGDPNGMLILSKENRQWLMTEKPAKNHHINVDLKNNYSKTINLADTLCNINLIS